MAKGYETGARVKGTPNKRMRDLTERLTELGCDPVEGMARLAMDPNSSPDLKGRMYTELAQYVYPKRRAVEQTVIDTKDEVTAEEILTKIREILNDNPSYRALIQPEIAEEQQTVN